MPDTRFATLGTAERAAKRFVVESLEASVLRNDSPSTINISVEFTQFLVAHGVQELTAADLVAEQQTLVRQVIARQIDRWSSQGVPSPVNFSAESETVLVTWQHPRFSELTGSGPINREFIAVYEWIKPLKERSFLLPCLCYLKVLGCNPIFVTDAARDEGIDCIGRIERGGLRSVVIFIQARSATNGMTTDPLLQEYAKYAALPRTDKYLRYLEALGVPRSRDGTGFLYAVLTNADFHYGAQEMANRLGVLCRSGRQLAHTLASHWTATALERLRQTVTVPAGCDLDTNLSPLIQF